MIIEKSLLRVATFEGETALGGEVVSLFCCRNLPRPQQYHGAHRSSRYFGRLMTCSPSHVGFLGRLCCAESLIIALYIEERKYFVCPVPWPDKTKPAKCLELEPPSLAKNLSGITG